MSDDQCQHCGYRTRDDVCTNVYCAAATSERLAEDQGDRMCQPEAIPHDAAAERAAVVKHLRKLARETKYDAFSTAFGIAADHIEAACHHDIERGEHHSS